MSKLTRVFQKVFGDSASAVNNFGVFGSLALGTPTYSKDPNDIQSLPAFLSGWASAAIGNRSPAFEEINSLNYLTFRQIAYLLQSGMAEWDVATDYYIGGMCRIGPTIYVSKTDNNIGNNPATDTNNWRDKRSHDMEFFFPVGEVWQTHRNGNPAALLGFGTWQRISEGRFPVGLSTTDDTFGTIGNVGGTKTATLTADNNGPHAHTMNKAITQIPGTGVAQAGNNATAYQNAGQSTESSGSGAPFSILPPYNVLFNYWLRTA